MQRILFASKTTTLALAAAALLCQDSLAATVPLSALDLNQMTIGWGKVQVDRGVMGRPLSIGGKPFAHGVGTHGTSKLRVELNQNAARFVAQVGLDDSAEGKGSVGFVVIGDGKVLWKSPVLTGGQPATPVSVDVSKVNVLELRVTDGGDGTSHDHADWAEAGFVMKEGKPAPVALAPDQFIRLATRTFALDFEVGDDGRLYQKAIGATEKAAPQRTEELYPQAGDGYIFEPALQVVHADGNTSTRLLYQSLTRTQEAPGRELTVIKLRDEAYPFEVNLCFRAHQEQDVIEQWTEIRHRERGTVRLERMASSSLVFMPDNVHLTHFHGDWADEMNPVTELLTPGTKVLDSKIGVRAHQFRNPSFMLSLDGLAQEQSGRVLAGSLAWSGSFACTFDHTGKRLRAIAGVNPFASAYFLKANTPFQTPVMIWTWSTTGTGAMSRKLHAWAREFGFRDGDQPRSVLLNNWEATGFDFDFDRIANLYAPAKQM
ncbi:MAG TPA: glycoside hydrolase family 36 N-terminal domain-containing protein, partial [Clostridia bacterium]|nr:glycoside hydrolase family 36 N-terminal domain-containing protein [Clostridia bacterium]